MPPTGEGAVDPVKSTYPSSSRQSSVNPADEGNSWLSAWRRDSPRDRWHSYGWCRRCPGRGRGCSDRGDDVDRVHFGNESVHLDRLFRRGGAHIPGFIEGLDLDVELVR